MRVLAFVFLFVFGSLLANAQTTTWVDPLTGTEGGNVFPGASLPFSLCKLGPDVEGSQPTSGYHPERKIIGFSHTHLSGTGGEGRYGNIMVTPLAGSPHVKDKSSFKTNEYAAPGYYAVTLQRKEGDVRCELTVTPRSGLHRYRFYTWKKERSFQASLLIDPAAVISRKRNNPLESRCIKSEMRINRDSTLEGYADFAGGWGGQNPYRVYFSIALLTPQVNWEWQNDSLSKDSVRNSEKGLTTAIAVRFTLGQMEEAGVRVGISLKSVARAKMNRLQSAGKSFDQIRNSANWKWEQTLNALKVNGGTPEAKKLFYTNLYHTFLLPTDVTDENPESGFIGPSFWDHYCLWDVFRSVMPLHTLIAPDHQRKVIQSLLTIYKQKGWLPDAFVAGDYASVQGGSNGDVVIADAVVKNLGGFDLNTAFEAIKKNADTDSDRPQVYGRELKDYRILGYLPSEVKNGSSRSLEYAYNDYCVGTVAKTLKNDKDSDFYFRRSQAVFALHDSTTGFFWAKDRKGNWASGFKPDFELPNSWDGPYFYEGTPWAYSTYVPHDIQGLINRIGGANKFENHLDSLFEGGHYSLSNEPEFLSPYLYNYISKPDKTALRVRDILNSKYFLGKKGLPGQDDSGALSSWYVWSALGLFPVAGQAVYLIGSPVFTDIELPVNTGKTFKVEAVNTSETNIYIQSATLNGKPFNQNWISHQQLSSGGVLRLIMGDRPSKNGLRGALPPSLSKPKKL